MNLTTQNILNMFSLVALVGTGAIFIFSQIRRNDLKVLRDSNADLRSSINDKSKKIDELNTKVDLLVKRVAVLEAQNSDLQILVKEALVIYFTRYPKAAQELQKE